MLIKKYKNLLSTLFLFIILSVYLIPLINSVPTDSWKVQVGDSWTLELKIFTESGVFKVGDKVRTTVSKINNTETTTLGQGDCVFVIQEYFNITTGTWKKYNESLLAIYNTTNTIIEGYHTYVIDWTIACVNLTAFEKFLNSSPIALTYFSREIFTYTYWDGNLDGTGAISGDLKYELVIDPIKYVVMSFKKYEWNGTSWVCIRHWQLVEYNWTEIPGFEIFYILIGIIGLISIIIILQKRANNFR